ncbi:citramalyl-CoA lyase, mitochondrial-like isoform X1 [Diorhabda sublineata]|uniref:citramalyl-CoA lyase, mitochondrial-like isoform X1 n=1 Tax=Diorhabda sublineata TaxID=1163346 RepID=UPI0024E10B30|nr:citramalyl-CoA lyase, mitochondrial-like isoform X1 [Diorhabda sublineata]
MWIYNMKLLKRTVLEISVRYYKPRRAILYVPGNDLKKINKIQSLTIDCVALDCEDGVALNKKDEARYTIRESLNRLIPDIKNKTDIGVRINSVDSEICEKDLEVCLSGNYLPHTILLPKVEDSGQLHWFSDCIDKYIKQRDKINLIIFLESAKAFINISEICKTLVTLADKQKIIPNSLVFGSDDYCASIGATRTEDATEVLYARQKLVLYAKAYNFQAIDMVYIKFKDLEGLIRQSEQGRHMGFTGKQVIHPDQIEVVQKSFSPTLVQVEWAKGLLRAFEEHQIKGIGAFTYEGSMIDMPTIKQAQNIIELMNSIK